MYPGNPYANFAAPQPQYPLQLGETSKAAQGAQPLPPPPGLPTPPFRGVTSATPLSEFTSSGSDASFSDGCPTPSPTKSWVQARAEQGRAAHIARVEAATARPNPYAAPSPAPLARPPWAGVGLGVRMHHGWERPFRNGSVTTDVQVRRVHARTIVDMGQWRDETGEVRALAGLFVERALEGYVKGFMSVAPFARELQDVFRQRHEMLAASFGEQLKQCVWEEFEAWWRPGKPTALISPTCQGRGQALAAGLGIAAFVGDLFNNNMLDAGCITECLQVLVGNMVVTEQIRAVDTILKHCDARLRIAESPALETLLWAFRTNLVRVNTSVVGMYQLSDKKALSKAIEAEFKRLGAAAAKDNQDLDGNGDDTPRQQAYPTLVPTAIWQPAPNTTPVLAYSTPVQHPHA
ncbi:hypothetical protein GSI_02946 [Ganoderma sinense ZZ0214-1]|uniref:Uncharacterized protein n=1 Tax=Ganoderma sinense ZZ0214-1 TaxID=1077348 RepID=A0A2G8SN04_9APHY|nr:hypothetical protein GSI_02946 [Ganoderma sinense ZZ0214-1]